jgi:hypothetical protein
MQKYLNFFHMEFTELNAGLKWLKLLAGTWKSRGLGNRKKSSQMIKGDGYLLFLCTC